MSEITAIQKSARTAGWAYLLIIVTSILSLFLGPFILVVEGDQTATIENIENNQALFRGGIAYDLLMYIAVIILSVALYRVLKRVNKATALVALLSRTGEALLGSATVVCSMMILYLINVKGSEESIVFLFDLKDVLLNIVFAYVGFGSVLFCYLFYRSKYIPRIISAFGIFAFVIVFFESIAVILFDIESTMFTGIPAILFEITIGIWLLVKGVQIDKELSIKVELT